MLKISHIAKIIFNSLPSVVSVVLVEQKPHTQSISPSGDFLRFLKCRNATEKIISNQDPFEKEINWHSGADNRKSISLVPCSAEFQQISRHALLAHPQRTGSKLAGRCH